MARIAEKLFLGGKKEAKDLDFLERNSISHILNCTPSRGEDPTAGVPNYHQQDARFTYDAARPVSCVTLGSLPPPRAHALLSLCITVAPFLLLCQIPSRSRVRQRRR
jgi:hypothetical protein